MHSTPGARIRRLELEQFRVFEYLLLDIPEPGVRVVGRNGTGKTSIVEAILLLSTTRSRRGVLDSDLIRHGSGEDLGVAPYARVIGHIDRGGATTTLDVYLERNGDSTSKKLLKIGDRSRRAMDVVGMLPTVSFSPEDLELVVGSPSVRRRFLDLVLSQTDRQYMRHLSRYARIISQRNGLLKDLGGRVRRRTQEFEYWDEQLNALGAYLIAARARAIRHISQRATSHFADLASEAGTLEVHYAPSLPQTDAWWEALESTGPELLDQAQRVGVAYESELAKAFELDVMRGTTQIGPHRDDLTLLLDGRDISRFGSRGQQRLAIVALKLAEIDFQTDELELRPIFLLDDVLSELDPHHRSALVSTVASSGSQLVVTSTDDEINQDPALSELSSIRLVEPGVVDEVD